MDFGISFQFVQQGVTLESAFVGAGMRTNAGVSARLFTALSEAGINIEMITTSEIRISVVTRADTDPIDDLLPYNWANTNAGQTAFEMSNLASAA